MVGFLKDFDLSGLLFFLDLLALCTPLRFILYHVLGMFHVDDLAYVRSYAAFAE